ncbi:hypothetical protein [Pelosinus sp. UFO1]|nr:hypothetical protein [Pelosinus sp. UFO1]
MLKPRIQQAAFPYLFTNIIDKRTGNLVELIRNLPLIPKWLVLPIA